MLRLIAAAALLTLAATPAMAQYGYYEQNNQSIYGGGSGGYHWRNAPDPVGPTPSWIPQVRQPTVCTTYGNQTICQ